MELLVELLPPESHVLVLDPERVRTRAHDLVATSQEFLEASWAAAASGGTAPIDLGAASLRGIGEVRTQVLEQGQAWWGISPFGLDTDEESRAVAAQPAEAYRGDIEAVVTDVRSHLAAGRRVVTIHQGHGPAQRMVEVLGEHDVPSRLVDEGGLETLAGARSSTTKGDGVVLVTQGCLAHGLVLDDPGLVIITGEDIAGQKATTPRHAQDAGAAQEADRPARAQGRRLRRARAARCRAASWR